jgi:uncharacterized damage-inducible protein DinB
VENEMTNYEAITEATRHAAREAFKYAKNVPADKLDWKPLDSGRSVLDICREMACCAGWSDQILKGQPFPEWNEEMQAELEARNSAWTTAEACEEECNRQLEVFIATVKDFPDEKLSDTFVLPFDGGQTITMRENMQYPLWNFTYHQGQIAYIQTLYGDKQMYW